MYVCICIYIYIYIYILIKIKSIINKRRVRTCDLTVALTHLNKFSTKKKRKLNKTTDKLQKSSQNQLI